MLKVEMEEIVIEFEEEIVIEFDTEGIEITANEKVNISASLSHLEMSEGALTLQDKPRSRQLINDELDRLNKARFISDEVVQNITYTLSGKEHTYVVETKVTLSKVDTVTARSEREAIELVEGSEDTDLYLDDLQASNDFSGVEFKVIDKE